MALPIDLWLIHPSAEMCDAFRDRFEGLPRVTVIESRFEDLPPHDCFVTAANAFGIMNACLLYTSPSPRDRTRSRMPSSA